MAATNAENTPRVGVGCIVHHEGRLLLVRNHRGYWSTPGGYLEFGESPAAAAVRETREETGVKVRNASFVALTNDIVESPGRHYVTIWMRAEVIDPHLSIGDTAEIAEAGWFDPARLPAPKHHFFENFLAGRTLPPGASLAAE